MRFSIIVPVFNVELYLQQALNSLFVQDYENFEVIMIDDGSTDRSAEVCKEYANRDARFKYFWQENQGQSVARNFGLSIACGEIIYFFDSDDMLAEGALKDLSVFFMEKNIDAIFFEASVFGYLNSFVPVYKRAKSTKKLNVISEFIASSLKNETYFVSPCCYAFRKEIIGDLRFKPGIIHEDELFYFKLFSLNSSYCLILNESLFLRRVRENSTMTSSSHLKHVNGYLCVINEIREYLDNNKASSEYYLVFKNIYSSYIYHLLKTKRYGILSIRERVLLIVTFFKFKHLKKLGFKLFLLTFIPELITLKHLTKKLKVIR